MTLRPLAILLLLTSSFVAFSQEKIKYFTYGNKPCTFDSAQKIRKGVPDGNKWHVYEYRKYYTSPSVETWYLDSNFTVADGRYIEYSDFPTKKVHTQGQCNNGKRTGLWVSVFESGKPEDTTTYNDGHIVRYRSYYENGRLQNDDRIDTSGNGTSKGLREDGRAEHSGQFSQWKKTGVWTYYAEQGLLCAKETMNADTITTALFYDEAGRNPVLVKKDFEKESDYPGGESRWLYYINKTLGASKLPDAFLKDEIQGTVVVSFMIDTEGNVTDTKVVQSVHRDLDSQAVQVVKSSSGKWRPGRRHNQLVKSYKMQPFTFRLTNY